MTAEIPVRPPSGPVGDEPARNPRSASTDPDASTGYVDLGAMILGREEAPAATRVVEEDEHTAPEEELASVVSRFRASLSRNLASLDARSHQDMGVAYRTMGLGQEAIGEFQRAIREDPRSLGAHEMLGRCFLDAGQPGLAADSLAKALELPRRNEDEFVGIYYYLGRALEESGNPEASLDFYRKTAALDIDFKDAAVRFHSLGRAAAPSPGESEGHTRNDPLRTGSLPPGRGS